MRCFGESEGVIRQEQAAKEQQEKHACRQLPHVWLFPSLTRLLCHATKQGRQNVAMLCKLRGCSSDSRQDKRMRVHQRHGHKSGWKKRNTTQIPKPQTANHRSEKMSTFTREIHLLHTGNLRFAGPTVSSGVQCSSVIVPRV